MKYILIIASLLFTSFAQAGQLGLSLGSYHLTTKKGTDSGLAHNDRKRAYNEFNPGITYIADNQLMVGIFKNSYNGTSVFGGKHLRLPSNTNVGLDLGLAAYGNQSWDGKYKLTPIIQATYDFMGWRVGYAPLISRRSYGVFTIQYIVPLN